MYVEIIFCVQWEGEGRIWTFFTVAVFNDTFSIYKIIKDQKFNYIYSYHSWLRLVIFNVLYCRNM